MCYERGDIALRVEPGGGYTEIVEIAGVNAEGCVEAYRLIPDGEFVPTGRHHSYIFMSQIYAPAGRRLMQRAAAGRGDFFGTSELAREALLKEARAELARADAFAARFEGRERL